MVNRAWQAIDFRQMPASKLSVPDPPIYRLPHAPRTKKAPRPAVVVDAPVPTTDTSSGGSGAGTGVQAGTVKVPRDDDTATAAKAPNASEADGADNGAEETKGSHRQSELPVMSALAAGYGAPASWRRLEGYSLCDGGPPSQSRRHRSDGDPVFARGNSGDAHAVVLTGRRGDGFWWHPLHWPQHDGRQLLQVRLSRQGRPRNWADPRSHAKAGEGIDGDGDGAGAGAGAGANNSDAGRGRHRKSHRQRGGGSSGAGSHRRHGQHHHRHGSGHSHGGRGGDTLRGRRRSSVVSLEAAYGLANARHEARRRSIKGRGVGAGDGIAASMDVPGRDSSREVSARLAETAPREDRAPAVPGELAWLDEIADGEELEYEWSAPIKITEVGTFAVKLRSMRMVDGSGAAGHEEMDYLVVPDGSRGMPDCITTMWLNVDVQMSAEGVVFVTLSLPTPTADLQKLEPPYRVDNLCSVDRLVIRQVGYGPAAGEIVPCCAAPPAAIPYTFALDNPTAPSKELFIQARPVGVGALFYWADGRVGEAAMAANWALAAQALESVCLGSPEVRSICVCACVAVCVCVCVAVCVWLCLLPCVFGLVHLTTWCILLLP